MSVLCNLNLCTETEAVTARYEAKIGQIFTITKTLERTLATCADCH